MVEPEEESDQDDEPYLHPSLASSLTKIEAVRFAWYTCYFARYTLICSSKCKSGPCALMQKNFTFGIVWNVKIP